MDDKPKDVNPEVTTEKDEELLKVPTLELVDLQHKYVYAQQTQLFG